jgi:hypothetical protein
MAYMLMPMYNLDKSVGPMQPNQSDDVKLLQVMLNEVAKLSRGSMPGLSLPVNGLYTDELCLWIRAFQEKSGLAVTGKALPMQVTAPSGRLCKVDWQSTSADGSISMMYTLNLVLRRNVKIQHDSLRTRLRLEEKGLAA